MTQLNRHTPPSSITIKHLSLLPMEKGKLDNDIELFVLKGGTQDVTKIDIFFPAGLVQAGKPLLASTVNNLLEEGTKNHTSIQLSEYFDFYGAHFGQNTSYHHSAVSLVTLTKHLPKTLPLVADIIRNPIFPESELSIYLNKKKHDFILDLEKVKTLAARKFSNVVFGKDHPYGMTTESKLYETVKQEELIRFHQQTYTPSDCQIVISGQPGGDYHALINEYLGDKAWKGAIVNNKSFPIKNASPEKTHFVKKQGAVQAAIRIGRELVTRNHNDFKGLQVLNTILGGYFGSRLMTSIREEKGYTYGISSYIAPLMHSGFWVIATEVNNDVRDEATQAIYHEMELLRSTPLADEELKLVKNYMLGDLTRNLDGPFSMSDNIKGLLENNMSLDFYSQMMQTIVSITAKEIQNLAIVYLNPSDFHTVIAG